MVAHRLDTAVEYCDKIMVLDQGQIVQFDVPLRLLVDNEQDEEVNKQDSVFAEMVRALTQS